MATADPFGRLLSKNLLNKALKPSGAPTTLTPAQRAQQTLQRQLAMRNEAAAPSGPTTAPTTAARMAALGAGPSPTSSGAFPSGSAGTSPAPGAVAAAAAQVGGIQNLLSGASGPAQTGGGAFPTGSGYTASTKLGQSYRDLMLPSAWDDPEALIDTFYRVNGLGKGSGDYGTQLESADNLGILYMALMGENAFQGNGNFVDWASNYLTDQRQADGQSISPGEIWNALTNPDSQSPLNYYLNNPSLTPEDQVNNMLSSMRYGLESTLPGPILNALLAQVDQMGREFRSLRNTQSGSASFSGYLGSRPGSLPGF